MRVLIDSDVVIAAMAGIEDQSVASQMVMDALAEHATPRTVPRTRSR